MLISTTADLMKYVEVSVDLDLLSVTPSINKAERRFIIPILGRTFYFEVQEYGTTEALTTVQEQLLDCINSASVPLAMWYYSQVGGVSIDNSGLYKPKSDTRWNLGDNEQAKLENHFLNSGLDALDDLLSFLDENLSSFETYATSPIRDETFSTLVPTASVVQKVFSLLHPNVTFRAMREAIGFVENRVAGLMQEFHDHAVSSDSLTISEKIMRDVARKAVIYMATSRALLTRTVKLTNEGLEVMMAERTPVSVPENSRIESSAREFASSGELELQKLMDMMNANPPTGYVAPVVVSLTDRCKNPEGSRIAFL